MSPENTQKLFEAFPRLYRGREKPAEASSMASGFDCGDGWFGLIWHLSQAIEEAARQEGRDDAGAAWPEAVQVKQKFGSLRFVVSEGSDAISTLIEEAAEQSVHTCESCGSTDAQLISIRRTVRALCPRHAAA